MWNFLKNNLWCRKCVSEERYFRTGNIFLLYNIKKKSVFRETVDSCFGGTFDHFLEKGGVLSSKIYMGNLFYHKLDAKYSQIGKIFLAALQFLIKHDK